MTFITCQNACIFGKYVGHFVCLFVRLFVCLKRDTGRNFRPIITKFGTYMYLGPVPRPIVFGVDDVIDDVMTSPRPLKF